MNQSIPTHGSTPALEMEIKGTGYALNSNGWTVERMVLDEAVYEAETGQKSPIRILFDYWREKDWGHGAFNPIEDLDIRVQCVDVNRDNPLHYQYVDHFGETFGNLTGKRILDLPELSKDRNKEPHFRLADLISWEYAEVKKVRVPLYYRLRHEIEGSLQRQYTKIVLPPIRNKLFLTTRLTAPIQMDKIAQGGSHSLANASAVKILASKQE
ncbi:MAG: hypothetical protein VW709_03210 [Rickettsiales bacterium]